MNKYMLEHSTNMEEALCLVQSNVNGEKDKINYIIEIS